LSLVGTKLAILYPLMMTDIYQIFFSNSNEMKKIKAIIDEISKTDIMVLIRGEVGTGKELLAETIHLSSQRRDQSFVKIDCRSMPQGYLSSEFLSLENNVLRRNPLQMLGNVKSPDGGTILLHNIDALDIAVQTKLLQFLRNNAFFHSSIPVEGDQVRSVAPRVLLTIKNRVEESVTERRLYDDLFSNTHFVSITVPPLRDRKEQIPSLSQYYLDFYKEKYGRDVKPFSSTMVEAFRQYDWPGNIDELEGMIKRIVILGDGDTVLQSTSGSRLRARAGLGFYENSSINSPVEKKLFTLKEVKKKAGEAAEAEIIKGTLEKTRWNRKRAAKLLGISYNALLYKIQKFDLT